MNYNQLGNSALNVSEIALGCMTIGKNIHNVSSLFNIARENGINFVDTADLYDFGLNEELIGQTIQPFRDEIILSTKGGNKWSEDKSSWSWNPTKKYLKEAVKHSLHRLRTDYIDLYQLHGGTIEDPIHETIEALDEMVQEGLIRYYGLSSMRPNVINEYVQHSKIVNVMMPYNLLDRRSEELFPLLKKNNISIITRGTLAKGLLTDTFESKLKESYLSYTKEEIIELLTKVKSLDSSIPLESYSLAFNLRNPIVASVVLGVSSTQQLTSLLHSYQNNISHDTLALLERETKLDCFQEHRL